MAAQDEKKAGRRRRKKVDQWKGEMQQEGRGMSPPFVYCRLRC